MSLHDFARAKCSGAGVAALERVVPRHTIVPFKMFPDEQAVAAVAAVAEAERKAVAEVLRAYGRFFVGWAKPSYRTAFSAPSAREFLKGTARLHAVAVQVNARAAPPDIRVLEPAPDRLELVYDSPRKLCPIMHGMIESVAELYGERVDVTEPACMHRGDPACRFDVRFA